MLAREWVIASNFRDPTAYDIPDLPRWRVHRNGCGRIAFADGDEEPFIAAERPVTVRR